MTTDTALETLQIETAPDPVASIIWMHGLGADNRDFEPVVPHLALGGGRGLRFVFPNAPVRQVTVNGGMAMRAWYDIHGFGPGSREDEAGVRESADQVAALIAQETGRGMPAERVFVAGFSQGGALALFTALRYPERLGGIIALSTYLPVAPALARELSDANRDVPIFLAHGEQDPVLPLLFATYTREHLDRWGYRYEWHSYPMPHAVVPEEIADIRDFLAGRLAAAAA